MAMSASSSTTKMRGAAESDALVNVVIGNSDGDLRAVLVAMRDRASDLFRETLNQVRAKACGALACLRRSPDAVVFHGDLHACFYPLDSHHNRSRVPGGKSVFERIGDQLIDDHAARQDDLRR